MFKPEMHFVATHTSTHSRGVRIVRDSSEFFSAMMQTEIRSRLWEIPDPTIGIEQHTDIVIIVTSFAGLGRENQWPVKDALHRAYFQFGAVN